MPQNYTATIAREYVRHLDLQPYEGEFHVRLVNPDGSIANTGRLFSTLPLAIAFAEGMDTGVTMCGTTRDRGRVLLRAGDGITPEELDAYGLVPVEAGPDPDR